MLERTDHDEIRDMDAVIALFARLRQQLCTDIVVDGRCRDGLRLLEFRRQIVQILLQKLHDLLHIEAEIRNGVPVRKPIGREKLFPSPELADDKIIVKIHCCTHLSELSISHPVKNARAIQI